MGFMGAAVAYQQEKTVKSAGADAGSSNAAFAIHEKQSDTVDRPARCYLALHLQMAGAPFSASAADVRTGLAHLCADEAAHKDSQSEVKED